MKVFFETFGCRLNRAEALDDEADYLARGWEWTDDARQADLIVVRGCSVTRRAERDSEKRIAQLRATNPKARFRIVGCLKDAVKTTREDHAHDTLPTRTARAYLKCQDGCSGRCTFCIVPTFRGSSVSTPFSDVLDRARRFIDAGYHEIVLTGCNLALYASEGKRLGDLLDALASLADDCRIRLGSLEPGATALRVLDVFKAHPQTIAPFLHIPVQSGSNVILRAMNRPYPVREVESLVEKAIETNPLMGLGCDLMTGFPGESENDFLETKSLLLRLPFSNAHIFPYSERPGTKAVAFPHAVPHDLRHRRAHALAVLAAEKRAVFASRFVNRDVMLVIEDAERRSGWTGAYLPCSLQDARATPRKSLVRARVVRADGEKLIATMVGEGRA